MRSGDLKRRLQIVQPTTAQDSFGQPGLAAGPDRLVLETWGSIALTTQRERYSLGAGFEGDISHTVTIRWTDTVLLSGLRILYGTRRFIVQTKPADPDEERRCLKMLCLELTK